MAFAFLPERIPLRGRSYAAYHSFQVPSHDCCYRVSSRLRCQIDLKIKMEKSMYKRELGAAIDVVERACRLCLAVQSGLNPNEAETSVGIRLDKSDASPVTVADLGVQALVSLELGARFPSIPLLGEEDSSQLREEQLEYEKKTHGFQCRQPLVDNVAQVVASVASKRVNSVTTENILDVLDEGVKTTTGKEAVRTSYWVSNEEASAMFTAYSNKILDPIDGTRGFLRGGDALYVVGLALVVDGEVVLGVMGCPSILYRSDKLADGTVIMQMANSQKCSKGSLLEDDAIDTGKHHSGLLMAACSGFGCWVKPLSRSAVVPEEVTIQDSLKDMAECKVDGCKSIREALFCISDHEVWGNLPLALALGSLPAREHRLLQHEAHILPLCCGSLCKYFAVALGGASLFVQHLQHSSEVKVWDHAAGVICVVEAGGQVTDVKGTHIQKMLGNGQHVVSLDGGSIIASNGNLHDIILRSLAC